MARHRLLTMVTATVLAAAAVCIGGLIGFLGLIVPNVLRRFFAGRMSARQMFTLSGLYGSALLIFWRGVSFTPMSYRSGCS